MKDTNWREELDLDLQEQLNSLIAETKDYDYAIKKSKDRSKAQMWVALALLNQKINQLLPEDERSDHKLSSDELDKLLNTLEKL